MWRHRCPPTHPPAAVSGPLRTTGVAADDARPTRPTRPTAHARDGTLDRLEETLG